MTTTLERALPVQGVAPPQAAAAGTLQATTARVPDPVPDSHSAPRPASGGTRQLALRGALSLSDRSWLVPQLDELVASGASTVRLDLSAVAKVDPGVARLLLSTSWRLEGDDRELVLLGARPAVRRTLKWCGAGHLIVR